jgi:integrase
MKLTTKNTPTLPLPADKTDHIFWDDEVTGLGLRLRAGGSRNWVFQYALGEKQRRMSLGSAKAIKLPDARKTAEKLHAKVKLGDDPAGQKAEKKARAADTFEAIGQRFLAFQKDQLKPGSYRQVERHMRHAKPLHRLQLAAIDRRTVASLISALKDSSGAVTANRVGSTLSYFFTWAMGQGIVENNPLIGVSKFEEKARERVLSDAELRLIWNHAGDDHYGSIVKLLMLTAQRADEIASLRWSEIGDDAITLPSARTKNGRQHVVPLSGPALAIVQAQPRRASDDGSLRDLVFGLGHRGFSGWSRCKERLDERITKDRKGKPLPHWTTHDLRRTAATSMANLGVQPHIIEAVLNHVSGHKSGVAGIYNRSTYEPEKRDALVRLAGHLMTVVEGGASNVTPLRRPA